MAQGGHPAEEGVTDAIVAPATAPGRGALGVVRVAGAGTRRIARALLGLENPEPRRATTRVARRDGKEIDRVVAVFWDASDSPLGEDLLEITAHGSPEILRALTDAAVAAGARPAEPGEFTRRAFTNGKLDLAQAEGVEALIAARGERARRAALLRLDGGLSRAVSAARAPILDVLTVLEARLDHPDEDLAPLTADGARGLLDALRAPLTALIAAHDRGAAARDGVRVALVGAPNAGKSSLLNALLGRDRAIVAPTPGTTRDTVEEPATLEGLAATLIDTAGLRDAADAAEREGVARAERALKTCDVAVLVEDGTLPPDAAARARVLALAAESGRPLVTALTKSDLGARAARDGGVAVSSVTGEGLDSLARAVAAAAGAAPADEGEAALTTARDRAELAEALASIDAARAELDARPTEWEDRAASRLRDAHRALGRILGEDAPDEVLRAVFARFCVGK